MMTARGRVLFHEDEDFERPGVCRSGWLITHVPLTVLGWPFGDVVRNSPDPLAADRVLSLVESRGQDGGRGGCRPRATEQG
jgi:hypothetical protein